MATLTDALRVFARSGKLIRFEAHADSGNVFLNLSEIRAPLNGGAQSPGNTSDIGKRSVLASITGFAWLCGESWVYGSRRGRGDF